MTIPSPIRLLLLHVSPPCDEITLLISKGMDTQLTLHERWRLKFHFILCTGCKRFNIQLHTLHEIIRESLNSELLKSDEDMLIRDVSDDDVLKQPFARNATPIILPSEARQRIQTAIVAAIGSK